MMPFVFFSTTQNNLCSIHNYFVLTSLTLSEKLGVGKIGKPKSKMRGWGGGFLFMYLSTIICNGGQRGWGSWGDPLCPCHTALAHCPKVAATCIPCPYDARQSPVPAGLPLTH